MRKPNAFGQLILIQWGPALLVCFTVNIRLFYQNARMNDLKDSFNKRFDDMGRRIDDLKASVDNRFDDLKDYIQAEFKRVDERIDRWQNPVVRK